MKSYSFKKKNNTDEIHIHLGEFKIPVVNNVRCDSGILSICEKSLRSESTTIPNATCLTEDEARAKAASIGRSVCGICVSSIYETYE